MLLRMAQTFGEITERTLQIATAPVAIAAEAVNATLKPLADAASETVETVHEALKEPRRS